MLGSRKQFLWELTVFFHNKNFIFLVRRVSFCYILKTLHCLLNRKQLEFSYLLLR